MVEFSIVEGEKNILLSIIIDNNIFSVLSLLSHISIYSFQKFYSVLIPVHATTFRAARCCTCSDHPIDKTIFNFEQVKCAINPAIKFTFK